MKRAIVALALVLGCGGNYPLPLDPQDAADLGPKCRPWVGDVCVVDADCTPCIPGGVCRGGHCMLDRHDAGQ